MRRRVTLDVCGEPVLFRLPNGLEDGIAATGTLPRMAGAADGEGIPDPDRASTNIRIAAVMLSRCALRPRIVIKFRLLEQLMEATGTTAAGEVIAPFSQAAPNS
jgi:hypothetical protein